MRESLEKRRSRLQRLRRVKERRGRRMILTAGVSAIVMLLAGIGIYYLMTGNRDNPGYNIGEELKPTPDSTTILVPSSEVTTTAKFYNHNSGGTTVRFFLVKDSESRPQLAMDASDACYKAKKGFRQTNACCMGCNNCGKVIHINNLGTPNTGGGCWPSVIPIKVENGSVVINKSDLDAKAYLFR